MPVMFGSLKMVGYVSALPKVLPSYCTRLTTRTSASEAPSSAGVASRSSLTDPVDVSSPPLSVLEPQPTAKTQSAQRAVRMRMTDSPLVFARESARDCVAGGELVPGRVGGRTSSQTRAPDR